MTPREVRLAFAGVLAAMALAGIDGTAVAPALPTVVRELHGFDRLSWVVTAYLLTSTVTIPIYGKLSDLYGRRRLFAVAIVVFVAGSVLCAAAQTMVELVVARGIQGLGAGGLIPLAIATIGDLFSPRERGRIQGYTAGLFAVTSVVGPLLGGVLTDHASWRWIFLVNVPVGAAALGVVLRFMHVPRHVREVRLDVLGSATMVAASTSLLLALVWGGNQYAWGSPEVLGLLAAGAAATLLFVVAERRAAEPILPMRLFRERTFSVATAAGPLAGAAMYTVTVYMPIYVQQVIGGSATGSGVVLIPYMLSWVATSMVVGKLVTRTGRYKAFPIAGGVVTVVAFFLLSRLGAHSSYAETAAVMIVAGLGMAPMFQTYTVAAQNAVPMADIGACTAAVSFVRSIGGALGLAAFAAVLTGRLTHELAARVPGSGLTAKGMLEPVGPGEAAGVAAGAKEALAASLSHAYVWCVPVMALLVVTGVLLPELPLRTVAGHRAATGEPGTASAAGD